MAFNIKKDKWILDEPMIPGTKELERIILLLQAADICVYSSNLCHDVYSEFPYLFLDEDWVDDSMVDISSTTPDGKDRRLRDEGYTLISFKELESSLLKLIKDGVQPTEE